MSIALALPRLLAEAPAHPNIWNPTIIGILTVASAIVLFCGSVYLLLATNMGARLGFLVAAAALSGFMLLLATLWWTSGSSGIDPPHGRSPTWNVVDVVSTPSDSKIKEVRTIAETGKPIAEEQLTNLKAAIDAGLVQAPATGTTETAAPAKPFAKFTQSSDYLVGGDTLKAFEKGGGTKNVFWHNPRYAAVQLCETVENSAPPACDPLKDTPFVILEYNLGTLRQPVIAYWFMSLLLFSLSMLALHWYEQDQRARSRRVSRRYRPATRRSRSHRGSRPAADRREQGRRCRVHRAHRPVRVVRRFAVLHGQGPPPARRARPRA